LFFLSDEKTLIENVAITFQPQALYQEEAQCLSFKAKCLVGETGDVSADTVKLSIVCSITNV
jgi:hypothetical protein